MALHIVLLVGFIFSAIVCVAVLKKAIKDLDSGEDPICLYWIPVMLIVTLLLVIFGTATVASIWLIVLDLGLV